MGTEILVGCFAHAPVPLDQTAVLDAGCGTGSYSDALLHYVGRIEAVDVNQGMLEVAAHKRGPVTASLSLLEDRRAAVRRCDPRWGHDQPGATPAGRCRRRFSRPSQGLSGVLQGSEAGRCDYDQHLLANNCDTATGTTT